ncbi:hypothetical protein C1T17_18220 [Sphingobium sp. SCG-1]|nr:hypothetical protein C1T17_18220 [Sphingobium sp. SCG-1]
MDEMDQHLKGANRMASAPGLRSPVAAALSADAHFHIDCQLAQCNGQHQAIALLLYMSFRGPLPPGEFHA